MKRISSIIAKSLKVIRILGYFSEKNDDALLVYKVLDNNQCLYSID